VSAISAGVPGEPGRRNSASRTTPAEIDEHLATLGVLPSFDLALDATITPQTFARSQPVAPSAVSVGPLPRIALSGAPHATGDALADLEILSVLGEGGMGRVHLARQRSLGREVAIKMLKDEVQDAHASEMLRAEATIMGRLEHPNVVPVHAVGLDDQGRLVLVMKRIDGAPWRDLMRDPEHPRWQALAPERSDRLDAHLGVLVQVCNALELAHQRGIVHRDIKPENVLLGAHGEVYLADWGIALRTEGAEGNDLVGTPAYMAPEMVVGVRAKIDARTDVFLLGATLHELLVGTPPNHGPTLHATLVAAMEPAPPMYDASVPTELATIARRAMSRDSADRFASALELRRAIDEVRNHKGSIALTRVARAQLDALAHGAAATDRELTECRFALTSALREWPGNAEAKQLLGACLRIATRHEIAREGAAAARALLDEIDGGDAALEAEVAALEVRARARDAELDRLRAIDADSDISVGFGARVGMFLTLVTLGIGLTVVVFWQSGEDGSHLGSWDIVRFGGVVFGAFLALMIPFGRTLLANAIGRRISLLFGLSTGGLFVHRVIAALHDVPAATTLSMDLVLLGVVALAAGTVIPRATWSALPVPFAIAACFLYPNRVPVIFSAGILSVLFALMILGVIELRARRPAAPAGSADRRPSRADDTRST